MENEKIDRKTCKHWWVERYAGWGRKEWVCESCGISWREYEMNQEVEERVVIA